MGEPQEHAGELRAVRPLGDAAIPGQPGHDDRLPRVVQREPAGHLWPIHGGDPQGVHRRGAGGARPYADEAAYREGKCVTTTVWASCPLVKASRLSTENGPSRSDGRLGPIE